MGENESGLRGESPRTPCFAVFSSGVIAGTKSPHTQQWPGGGVQVDFYDVRGYQIWIAEDRAFNSLEAAKKAFQELYAD
jgi:hypothetical protein